MMTGGLVTLLTALRSHIAALDERIADLVPTHPGSVLFASLPGTGPVLVPRLIAAFGTRRDRFQSADEMERCSGIGPVKIAGGKTERVCFRWACPKFLRQTFHEFASHSIGHSEWAKAYYQHLRTEQKGGSPLAGVQMDSYHLPLLEGRKTLRRAGVPEVLAPAGLSARRRSCIGHRG